MARIRSIKPGFFTDEDLYDAEVKSGLPLRVAFSGLWTVADREGRFEWKPRTIKTDVLPYDPVDFCKVMDVLAEFEFIEKYQVDGKCYGRIPTWARHQVINARESKSVIPAPEEFSRVTDLHVHARGEGKGKEGKGEGNDASLPNTPVMTVGFQLEKFDGDVWADRIIRSWPLEDRSNAVQTSIFEAIEDEVRERKWPRVEAATFVAERVAAIAEVIKTGYPPPEWKFYPLLKVMQQKSYRRELETWKNPKSKPGASDGW